MRHARSRIALVTALALLLTLAAPLLASASTPAPASSPKPLVVKPDQYEPDDTTATAKVLPAYSVHTIVNTGTVANNDFAPDVDMFKLTAEATGTPFCIEVQQMGGSVVLQMEAFEVDGTGAVHQLQSSVGVWGAAVGGTMRFNAPRPGTFFVAVSPVAPFGTGMYGLAVTKGLAERIAGYDRFSTAGAVSRLMWPLPTNVGGLYYFSERKTLGQPADPPDASPAGCVMARGDDFADALAGSAFAGMVPRSGMPVLLTSEYGFPYDSLVEAWRLAMPRLWTNQPFTVYILGGDKAIPRWTEQVLRSFGGLYGQDVELFRVVRISGANRFATAAAIASAEVSASAPATRGHYAFLVNGFSFPDALAASPVAAAARGPVLMTRKETLAPETKAFLLAHPEIDHIVVAGSSSVVATSVLDELSAAPLSRTVTRVAGRTRYQTALALAEFGVDQFDMNPEGLQVVSGQNFPDGLAAGPMSAFTGAPLLLTQRSTLSTEVTTFIDEYSGTQPLPFYVVGGPAAVSDATFKKLNDHWKDN
jgi:putative cell wall-binding protein